jgi:hypothetical protein
MRRQGRGREATQASLIYSRAAKRLLAFVKVIAEKLESSHWALLFPCGCSGLVFHADRQLPLFCIQRWDGRDGRDFISSLVAE